jgi:predicted transcriptional regulator
MMALVKDEARQMVDNLAEDATWDDLMYEIYVKQKVTDGLHAADNGKVVAHADARKRLGKR